MSPEESARRRRARDSHQSGARARVLDTAYDLFAHHGIRAIGIDRIVAESGVAKMTLYRHFPSKEELVLAFLRLREERWTRDWLEAEMNRRGGTPRDRLLAAFDALDEWFHRPDYEGCSFMNTLLEIHEEADSVRREAIGRLGTIRSTFELLAAEAGTPNPAQTANQIQILMMGAIVSSSRGHLDAARDAREVARLLLGG